MSHNYDPSKVELKHLADDLMSRMQVVNNDPELAFDAKADTIAVGHNKGDVIITGNLKERHVTDSTDKDQYVMVKTPGGKKIKMRYADYGITKALSKEILSEVEKSPVYTKSQLNVKTIEEKLDPKDNPKIPKMIDKAKDHASKHAEMKMLAYCGKKPDEKLREVGISKEPCKGCYTTLSASSVGMEPADPGTKKVTNWRLVDKDEVEVRGRIDRPVGRITVQAPKVVAKGQTGFRDEESVGLSVSSAGACAQHGFHFPAGIGESAVGAEKSKNRQLPPDVSAFAKPSMASSSSYEAQEEVELSGVVHSIAYCKETRNILLCDSYNWKVEHLSHSPSSGRSLRQQKTLTLDEEHLGISNPQSVHIAWKLGAIFVGCESDKGISVLDRNSHQLIKKFAQDLSRDFDYLVVDDEMEDPKHCIVYASSTNSGKVTKLDYSSGKMLSELSVTLPSNITLKDDKLYLISQIDSVECVLVIDKQSLKIQNKFVQSGWSMLGGLCLDEHRNVCVTARNESNHRVIYSFDDGGKLIGQNQLSEFDEDAQVLDMVFSDKDLVVSVQELGPEFLLKRFTRSF